MKGYKLLILNCVELCSYILEVCDKFVWAKPADKEKPVKDLEAFRWDTVTRETMTFSNPIDFDIFLTELKTKTASCNFQER